MKISVAFTILATLATHSQAKPAPRSSNIDQHAFSQSVPATTTTSLLPEAHTEAHILSILEQYSDPVEAMIALHPSRAAEMSEPRYLEIMSDVGKDGKKDGRGKFVRGTEGDKLRLRREGVDWIDWTGREEMAAAQVKAEPNLPPISHQFQVRKALPHLSTINMFEFLEHFTSYYNRLYTSETGVKSQRWLFDEITDIVRKAPSTCRLSLEQFPHSFPQNSIIARFSPAGPRRLSQNVTIISAHLDSVNQYFVDLNAPGADDDASGTASILEAFRTLVAVGFEPVHGPVEFHWYGGEEAGLLGAVDVAADYKSKGIKVSGVLNVDETAYVKANSTRAINLIEVGATKELMDWVVDLAKEYVDIGVKTSGMVGRGLDHQAWTRAGYPAVSIVEGDQAEGGWFPYPHTVLDRVDIPPALGEFSYDHMREFSKVAVAFAIEQAGMVNHEWRPRQPKPTDI